MSRSNDDLLALKAELTNDPLNLGLTVLPADDEANANLLNLERETIQVKRRAVATAEIFNAIDPLEHQALTDQQSRWLDALLSLGQFDAFVESNIIAGLNGMFSAQSTSRPAYTARLNQAGNRVDALFQAGSLETGGFVSPSDIAQARNAT